MPIDRDDSLRREVDTQTTELARLLGQPREFVRSLAQQEIEALRVAAMRSDVLNRYMEPNTETGDFPLDDKRRTNRAAAETLVKLMALERYERRALSTLRRMLRKLDKS